MVGRKNLKFGRRDVLELTHEQSVKLPPSRLALWWTSRRTRRRYRMAKCLPEKRGKMRKGQLFAPDYTVKLFATVEFWMACRAVARRAKAEAASGIARFCAQASAGGCNAVVPLADLNYTSTLFRLVTPEKINHWRMRIDADRFPSQTSPKQERDFWDKK